MASFFNYFGIFTLEFLQKACFLNFVDPSPIARHNASSSSGSSSSSSRGTCFLSLVEGSELSHKFWVVEQEAERQRK